MPSAPTLPTPVAPGPDSVDARRELGEQARDTVSPESLGSFEPSTARPDPVALLQEQAASRVQELVPIRYGRMLASPFSFYRGAALIMASDLSVGARSGLDAQLCGDAHLSNFGAYASPERRLVFDINDFDETGPGPFEWDVKRLVTSMEVAGLDRGFDRKARNQILRETTRGYREAMRSLAEQPSLEVWYASIDVDAIMRQLQPLLSKQARKTSDRNLGKARSRNSLQAARKLTEIVDGRRRFIDDPPVIERVESLLKRSNAPTEASISSLPQAWEQYVDTLQPDRRHLLSEYHYVDLARKVVGVGSVGTQAWALLLQGRDSDDLLLLQLKEAQASVLEAFTQASPHAQHGERVVNGQRLLQSASDIFLGWSSLLGVDYYVRQLRDWKVSADIAAMDAPTLGVYGRLCGATLAKGHARSGDRIAISAYLGDDTAFDDAMKSFARAYAEQNQSDYEALRAAARSGAITVIEGV